MTANNDFNAAASSPLEKDSQNYSEEQFFPSSGSSARRSDRVSCRERFNILKVHLAFMLFPSRLHAHILNNIDTFSHM